MKKIGQIESISLLFLSSGIVTLFVIFVIISCGEGPYTKLLLTDRGPFAVNLGLAAPDQAVGSVAGIAGECSVEGTACVDDVDCPQGKCSVATTPEIACRVHADCPDFATGETCDTDLGGETCILPGFINPLPILELEKTAPTGVPPSDGKEFAIEAWVKRGSSNLSGGIFGYLDYAGIVLFVNNDVPKFGIRRNPIDPLLPGAEPIGCTYLAPTSTECIVSSGITLQDVWTHIAGALTSEDQSSGPVPASCSAVGSDGSTLVGAEQPHLAIYIDGNLENCGTTGFLTTEFLFAETPRLNSNLIVIGAIGGGIIPLLDGNAIRVENKFTGTIDEVRYWHVARTQFQISTCMNQTLGVQGICKVDPSILIGYWRLNEGAGIAISDASGNGFAGSILMGVTPWDGGWVTGKL